MALMISETYVNQTRGHIIGESGIYEPYTDEIGRLFREMQHEYGRCASSVYVDTADGRTKRIGWVFERTERYEDTDEPYMREVWVTLHEAPDTVTRTPHYVEL